MATRDERTAFDDLVDLEQGGGPRFTSESLDERRRDLGIMPEGPRTLASDAADDRIPVDAEAPAAASAPLPRRAGFFARCVALFVDLVALALAELALGWVVWTALETAEQILGRPLSDAPDLFAAYLACGSLALVAGYFVVLHAGTGQTLGKAALGLRVARPDGRAIGIGRSAVRFMGYFLSALPFGLGFLLALASSRRALHDLLAGTAVVRA